MFDRFRCGGVAILPDEGRLAGPLGTVHVRPRSMDVLGALAAREGEVVGKQALLDEVWGEAIVSDAVLTNAVAELRRALAGAGGTPRLIETVAKRGYRLTAPIETATPRPDATHSLAVLPFDDLGPEGSDPRLLDGLRDALVGELAHLPALRVLARAATARWRPDRGSLPRLGRELQVAWLVLGAAVRNGTRMRLNVQLVDLVADRVAWSTSLVVLLADPIELQSSLARALARELAHALGLPPAPPRAASAQLDRRTSELFVRGQLRLRGSTVDSLEQGLADLSEVVRRMPGFAAAHAGLARGLFFAASWRGDPGTVLLARAEAAAARALALEPESTEGRIWWVMTHAFGRWRAADALWELARIVQDHPRNPEARDALAHCLAALGRPSEAVAEAEQALRDDPASPALRTALGFFLRATGDTVAAVRVLTETLALHPGWTIARLELGRLLLEQGRPELAAQEIGAVEPDWGTFLAAIAGGDRHLARRLLDGWHAGAEVAPYWLAERCMWAGDETRALVALERAYAEHHLRLAYLGADPVFAPLHAVARFRRLVDRVGAGLAPFEPRPTRVRRPRRG